MLSVGGEEEADEDEGVDEEAKDGKRRERNEGEEVGAAV